MSKKDATDQPPLLLCQVLEEEFVQLHGPLPYVPGWEFKDAHFRLDAEGAPRLVSTLRKREDALARYLFLTAGLNTARTRAELAAKLNALLEPSAFRALVEALPVREQTSLNKLCFSKDKAHGVYLRRRAFEQAFPDDLVPGHEARLAEFYAVVHRMDEKEDKKEDKSRMFPERAALCFSGGGIRSATFCLGVMQALARSGVLTSFSYLSTVSGGGFVGSWFSAWVHRHPEGLDGVVKELAASPAPRTTAMVPKMEPEAMPIRHLRNYSNYLSPKLGFLSADTWTLVAIYLRNLLLNWLVIIPLLVALLALPRLLVMAMRAPSGYAWSWAMLALGSLAAVTAIAYAAVNRPGAHEDARIREGSFWWHARQQGGFLRLCLAPLIVMALCWQLHWIWFCRSGQEPYTWGQFVIFGAVIHLAGWLLASLILTRREKVPTDGKTRDRNLWVEGLGVILSGAAGGLLLGWSALKLFPADFLDDPRHELIYACFGTPFLLGLFLVVATLFVGAVSRWTTDEDREWWGRLAAWGLITLIGWAVLSALVVFGPMGFVWLSWKWQAFVTSAGGLAGLLALLLGRSPSTPANRADARKSGRLDLILNKISCLAAPLFVVFFLVLLAFLTSRFFFWIATTEWGMPLFNRQPAFEPKHWPFAVLMDSGWGLVLGLVLLSAIFGVSMALLLNVNKFSLHSIYRDRLIRAYLGASRLHRQPNPFTGFDPNDNLAMHELRPDKSRRPLHLINLALNLVRGENLAWQERKAETFTISALHAGNFHLGYRKAEEYGCNSFSGRAISLGTAVTISGAAASPNMGYHSSPVVAILLTLFNVRLGWWLGNPGPAGAHTYQLSCPKLSLLPMVHEAFGLTDNRNPYIYLSDGGHFENLGLYEMILRRCHFIVISDAGCDPECAFEDLGNAIRKVRIDLGIPIELKEPSIFSRKAADKASRYCAVGTINYRAVDGSSARNGTLIYLKPVIRGGQPMDVFNYAHTSAEFPHESTGDQFFSETQFESYRMLGGHTVEEIYRLGDLVRPNLETPITPLNRFKECAEGYLLSKDA